MNPKALLFRIRGLLKNRLVSDSLILLGVQISAYVLPFVAQPYLARVLGPDNVGLVGLGAALSIYFISVVEYGFNVVGPRQIAVIQTDREEVNRTYSTIMACKAGLLLGSGVVFSMLVALTPQYRAYWPLYAVSFVQVIGWSLLPTWLIQGMQRMRLVAVYDYGAKLLSVVLIFVLVRQRSDYLAAAALQAGAFLMAAIIGLTLVFSVLGIRLVKPSWEDMRRVMRSGWPVFLSMVSVTVVASSNTLILGSVSTNAQVGFMSSAMRIIIASRALLNPVSSAVFPHMSKLAAHSPAEGMRLLRKQMLWVGAPFFLLSMVLLLFGPLVARVIFGPEFEETGVLLRIMSLTPFVYAISTCFGNYMLAFGYEKQWSKVILRMTVLNFAALAVLLQVMPPARAVALTTTSMDFFTAVSCMLFVYRRTA